MLEADKRLHNVCGCVRCGQTVHADVHGQKIRSLPVETNTIAVRTGSGFLGVFQLH